MQCARSFINNNIYSLGYFATKRIILHVMITNLETIFRYVDVYIHIYRMPCVHGVDIYYIENFFLT